MKNTGQFYIDGSWVSPVGADTLDVINPATEESVATIAMGGPADVDAAVAAAKAAFATYSLTTVDERLDLLDRVRSALRPRLEEFAEAITLEMGAPRGLARAMQAEMGIYHVTTAMEVLSTYEFEYVKDTALIVREPLGVVGMITPWNWPINQLACKVAPALAAGCTMVVKPSEVSPLSAIVFAEALDEAGVPAGVFNLVNGDGLNVGAYLSAHPDIDMVSFTGSTRAGIEVAKNAAPTVKRVAQELGGKSANIILDDACFEEAISRDAFEMCLNSGQSCNAGTRMLVPRDRMDEAARLAELGMDQLSVGDPQDLANTVGPVASEAQWIKIQELIQIGIDEGATLVCGGCGRPDGLDTGFYVRPTLFADVTNDMRIAREEIFGPVLVIIGYEDDDDAVDIANDTSYGLSGYISGSHDRALAVARRIRTGAMHLNGAGPDLHAPFGGYKQSGNGREWGRHGFEEYLETKAVLGAGS
ncbi:MAG: aldehyde dehydrogenase family protein [Acidimicrobiales bacterium]|jgi:aldehyde dehydrogenase (NAD+)|nr:aldehyde dehydrogenase family protein [Actinomycetes bacterium]MDP6160435.1 aldehyde dehydrogenase family protein [Acidimicrobiales bacterium]MDP6911838.1 aldehyde dehydrogenase family protein [Acidimicrobiales bacterium]